MGHSRHDNPPTHSRSARPDEYEARLRNHLAGVADRTVNTVEQLPLSACAGRVTAEAVTAPVDLPLVRNSQMDGYAVYANDIAHASAKQPVTLPVNRIIAAGQDPGARLEPGWAVKIMTGAALPDGADCVIPVEHTEPADGAVRVRVFAPRSAGTFVRSPGEDVRTGDRVLQPGVRLGARQLAATAALGLPTLPVRPRPRVALIATGAELVPVGSRPGPGEIWDSNNVALSVAVKEAGGEPTTVQVVGDDPGYFEEALDVATGTRSTTPDAAPDLVITTGAVGMGDFEVVRQTLEGTSGAWFGQVGMQPGGPQGLATWADVPIVCLPGNPVSVLVSFVVLLRRIISEAAGISLLPTRMMTLAHAVTSPVGRTQFLRVTLDDGIATPLSGPGSHLIATMGRADGLAEIPADDTEIPQGAKVRVWPL